MFGFIQRDSASRKSQISGAGSGYGKLHGFSIRNKLIASFALVLLAPTILVAVMSYNTAKSKVDEQMTSAIQENVRLLDATLDEFLAGKKTDVSWLAQMMKLGSLKSKDGGNVANDPALHQLLLDYGKGHPAAEMAFIGTGTGLYLDSAETTAISPDYDPRIRSWYKMAMAQKGQVIVSSPYLSAATGNLIVTLAQTTGDGQGVAAISFKVDSISQIAKNVKVGQQGYVYILDKDKKVVVHPYDDVGKEPVSTGQTEKLFQEEKGAFTLVDVDGQEKKIVFATNKASGWKLAGAMNQEEVAEEANPILKITAIVLVLSVLVAAGLIAVILYSILKPLRQLSRVSLSISEGNLSEKLEVKRRDELGLLAYNFNRMAEALRSVIYKVNDNTMQLAASAEELTASSEQNAEGSRQVSQSVQEVVRGSEQQLQRVTDTKQEMNGMVDRMIQIAHRADQVARTAQTTIASAQEGDGAIRSTEAQMNEIGIKVGQLAKDVAALGERAAEIVGFAKIISEIASQTNLLALNASIEAARAGEHGKGFSVVAHEIKKLADQSNQSAGQISVLIRAIQEDTRMTASTMNLVTGEVNQGIRVVQSAGVSFGHILKSIQEAADQIQEVSQATGSMSRSSEKIMEAMETVSQVSSHAVDSVQNVMVVTEQQHASMQEIASSSAVLTKMAEELQLIIGRFTL